MTKEGKLFIITQRFQCLPETPNSEDPFEATCKPDGAMYLIGILSGIGFLVSILAGSLNYYLNGYHNPWALNLLQIGTPIFFYIPWITYTLLKWSVTWKWMPFDQKTIIWTKFPLNFWFLISLLWSVPCITSLLFFIVGQSFLHIWCGLVISLDGKDGVLRELVVNLYKVIAWALYSLGIGFKYPNGQAMARINKEWDRYYPNTPSSTNQLGPGPTNPPTSKKDMSQEDKYKEVRPIAIFPCYSKLPCIECNLWETKEGKCSISRVKSEIFYSPDGES